MDSLRPFPCISAKEHQNGQNLKAAHNHAQGKHQFGEAGEESVYVTTEDGIVRFTTDEPDKKDYDGCRWKQVEFDFENCKTLKNLGLFPGEPKAYFYVDTNGERLPLCGGCWGSTSSAGVFHVNLYNPRADSAGNLGFRSAYYRKRKN